MNLRSKAHEFSNEWYDRDPQGRDQPTLAFLLERLLLEAWFAGAQRQRDVTMDALNDFVPKVQP